MFLCLEERRKAQKSSRQRAGRQEVSLFFGLKVRGDFYSPDMDYEVAALQGSLKDWSIGDDGGIPHDGHHP